MGLGLAFVAAVDRAIDSIRRWPRAAAVVEGTPEGLEIRSVSVPRFPFFVAYPRG